MLGLFKTPVCKDSALGEIRYARGLWRGSVAIDGCIVPLALEGSRSGPSVEALALAKSGEAHFLGCRAQIEAALYSHFLALKDAVGDGQFVPEEPLPALEGRGAVWSHVRLEYAAVVSLGRELITELGYSVQWEEEHMLGVRLQNGRLVELCGSVVAP